MQYNNLGKFIRFKRTSLEPKVSLNTFALNCGFEPSILSRIETSKQEIKSGILALIAKGFKKTLSEFIAEYEQSEFSQD